MSKSKIPIWFTAIIVTVLFVLVLILSVFFPRVKLDKWLETLANESDGIPAYVVFGVLHTETDEINISQKCREQNKNNSLQEIFCIAEGKAYFVYVDMTAAHTWTIASLDLKTMEFRDICQFLSAKGIYRDEHYGDYGKRNGFYYDGQIILSDFTSVLVYDIHRNVTSWYDYNTYAVPRRMIYGEVVKEQTLCLHINDYTRTFTLQEMAENSDGIARIYALKDKETWNGSSYLVSFLNNNRIQVIGDKIYTIEAVLNYSGEPYAVILEYNCESDSWLYVSKSFAGDTVHGNCYIIPSSSAGDGLGDKGSGQGDGSVVPSGR